MTLPFKPLPADYKPEIDLLDRRHRYVDQLSSQKDRLIESAFLPLIKGNILDYKGRLQCVVNHAKVETYYFDNIPVVEIYPLRWDRECGQFGDPKLTCYWDYRILYREKKLKRFTLNDLKSGHRVENRMGVRYVVLKDSYNDVMLFSDGCYSSAKYDNDLLCTSYPDADIVKVFLVDSLAETLNHKATVTLLWERPTYSELFNALEAK